MSGTRWIAVAALAKVVMGQEAAPPTGAALTAQENNVNFDNYIFIILGSLAVGMMIYRVLMESTKYVRRLVSMNNNEQRYFAQPNMALAKFKRHFLYAPIGKTRHNKEIQLTKALSVGTLPTRFQLLFLIGYFATNVLFCAYTIQWGSDTETAAKELRNRTGILSMVNMVPLFIMATRNNPLISWANMSFDTFNLLHRWFGRIVALEAISHTIAYGVQKGSWAVFTAGIGQSAFLQFGVVGVGCLTVILFQASSILRHAGYEFFKYFHISLAIGAIVGVWYHCKIVGLPQITLLYGVIAVWSAERFTRICIIMYRNVGNGGTSTLVEVLPGNACRVTVELARPWTFKPGCHAYLYIPSIGFMTSHPFSIAWTEEGRKGGDDDEKGIAIDQKSSISFVIRARTGFTAKLLAKAEAQPQGKLWVKGYAEGPYGGIHMMDSYGTVMMFAGGVGITHQVPHVKELVKGYAEGTVAARKIILVWVIQSPEHLEWIRPWMTAILAMDKRRDCLRIMLFVSRPRSTKEIHSPSATVQMFPGRPNIETLIELEMENQVGMIGISVCGAGALSDDVRRAVRNRQYAGNIDFIEEAFSW